MSGEEKKGDEQRRSPRRPAGWRTIIKSPSKGILKGRIENASAQGFLLDIAESLAAGEILTLKIEVMHAAKRWEFVCQVQVRHIVFRTSSFLAGTEIVKITAKDAKFLHDFSFGLV